MTAHERIMKALSVCGVTRDDIAVHCAALLPPGGRMPDVDLTRNSYSILTVAAMLDLIAEKIRHEKADG